MVPRVLRGASTAWAILFRRATRVRVLQFLRTTPARLLYIGLLTLLVIASMFLFTRRVYATLSPLALHRLAMAKWFVTAAAASLAVLAFLINRRTVHGRRRSRALTLANLIGFTICYFLLDPPPRVAARDIEELKIFNAEHDDVQVTPDISAIARGVELSGETDPLKLAQSTLACNKLEESLRLFDKGLLDMKPMERVIAETHFYKAVALSRLKRDEEALAETELALALQPHYASAFAQKCRSLRVLKRLIEALAACQNATRENGAVALAWRETGAVYLVMGIDRVQDQSTESKALYEQALATLDISLQADPNDPKAWNNKCIALYRLGRLTEALAAADQALRLNPDFVDALLERAVVLKNLGRIDAAILMYRRLTQINAHDTEAWSNLASALEKKKDFTNALEAAVAATQANPDFEDAWFNKGEILNKSGRYAEALTAFARAIVLNPKDSDALVEQAEALEQLGRRAEATETVTKALSISPTDKEALALKERLLKPTTAVSSKPRAKPPQPPR
jgi:tetratricopeptide (TPR) repeat protein